MDIDTRPSEWLEALQQFIFSVIRQYPEGLSEHDLIKQLQNPENPFFAADALRDNLTLFRCHFLVFHCLYQLKQELAADFELQISALKILLVPHQQVQELNSIASHDPLADYYLDLGNLEKTNREGVEDLLKDFWTKVLLPDNRDQALETLQLTPPVEWPEIKVQYRRLAKQHHPDKGGDEETFKAVCLAFQQLKVHYQT